MGNEFERESVSAKFFKSLHMILDNLHLLLTSHVLESQLNEKVITIEEIKTRGVYETFL
jgi:hypothetical protein